MYGPPLTTRSMIKKEVICLEFVHLTLSGCLQRGLTIMRQFLNGARLQLGLLLLTVNEYILCHLQLTWRCTCPPCRITPRDPDQRWVGRGHFDRHRKCRYELTAQNCVWHCRWETVVVQLVMLGVSWFQHSETFVGHSKLNIRKSNTKVQRERTFGLMYLIQDPIWARPFGCPLWL